jgi:hypothetical protein
MTKIIGATVRDGRIEVEAPPEWPDGTEVHVYLVCRAGVTANDSGRTGAEWAVIWDLMAREDHAARGESPTEPD